ncbi:hypothetical protein GIB67_032712 [Kingdonia uniflora]|uniref:Uncharacterized protein n=1 Tax=Kingdonia uniflora TaxID=39325 RepID=A0A7J7MW10_9MAGN|nr:hypothetical protein GIB67_032712 [Kingdonia uniflora]
MSQELPMKDEEIEEVEKILGYKFCNKELVKEALLHPNYYPTRPCVSYDRLALFGDSVLNLLITKNMFFTYQTASKGVLTRLRGANVDNDKLARVAVKLGLYKYLYHKDTHLQETISEFERKILDHPLHSNGLVNTPKFLADIVESLIGAVFVDSNCSLDITWKVFKGLLEPTICLETLRTHPVSELHELCQKKGSKVEIVNNSWRGNMAMEVLIDSNLVGSASYGMKKVIAKNMAAKAALDNLNSMLSRTSTTSSSSDESSF